MASFSTWFFFAAASITVWLLDGWHGVAPRFEPLEEPSKGQDEEVEHFELQFLGERGKGLGSTVSWSPPQELQVVECRPYRMNHEPLLNHD